MQNPTETIAFPQLMVEKNLKTSTRASVCLVRDPATHTRYIYRTFSGSGEVYQKMRAIQCEHLPRIHAVEEKNGLVHVLEEYIQGDTLAFLLEGGPISAALAKQILIQICHGLDKLHSMGAVHRDIKPENIIMRGSEAVLIDFDASRFHKSESTSDTHVMGTTGYAAPEQYGFSQTDARADIYALGILLNEMVTGQHPSKKLAEGRFRPVIQKCTQINADQRYASVAELMEAMDPLPKASRHAIGYILLTLLVFVMVLGGGMLYPGATAPAETTSAEDPVITTEPPSTEPYATEMRTALPEATEGVNGKIEISPDPWTGSTEGHATTFQWDADGDGKKETYLFGVDYIKSPVKDVVYQDRNLVFPGNHPLRTVHPCVWQVASDGSMEPAISFAELLTDAQTNVWRVDDFVSPNPEVWAYDYIWPGSVRVIFTPKQDGVWLYEISAYLEDQLLTASATSSFYYE